MGRDTGTTKKPIMSACAFRHSILTTQRHVRVLGHFVLYFQLGCVRMYTDFRVWHNNYGILATNVNPVMAPLSGGTVATGLNVL